MLAVFDENGFPIAFYDGAIHGDGIPDVAIEISREQWIDLLSNPGQRKWVDGEIIAVEPSQPVATIIDYENAIQNLVDNTARERQFRDGVTLASYIGSTKANWAAEAQAFVAWRDNVWFYAYGELAKVQAGERQQPTVEQLLTEIAPVDWPAN